MYLYKVNNTGEWKNVFSSAFLKVSLVFSCIGRWIEIRCSAHNRSMFVYCPFRAWETERGTTCNGEAITIFSLYFPTTRSLRTKRNDCTSHVVLTPKRGEWGDYGLFNLEDRVILYEICMLGCCYCEEFGVREITAEQLYDHAVKLGEKLTDDAKRIIDLVQEFTIEF